MSSWLIEEKENVVKGKKGTGQIFVVEELNKIVKKPGDNKVVQVLVLDSDKVAVGVSGQSSLPKHVKTAKQLEMNLNNAAGWNKYKVSAESMPEQLLNSVKGGCSKGNCAEPKAAMAASKVKGKIIASDTRKRGDLPDKHQYEGINAESLPVDDKQLTGCPTCSESHNKKVMAIYGNRNP